MRTCHKAEDNKISESYDSQICGYQKEVNRDKENLNRNYKNRRELYTVRQKHKNLYEEKNFQNNGERHHHRRSRDLRPE